MTDSDADMHADMHDVKGENYEWNVERLVG